MNHPVTTNCASICISSHRTKDELHLPPPSYDDLFKRKVCPLFSLGIYLCIKTFPVETSVTRVSTPERTSKSSMSRPGGGAVGATVSPPVVEPAPNALTKLFEMRIKEQLGDFSEGFFFKGTVGGSEIRRSPPGMVLKPCK